MANVAGADLNWTDLREANFNGAILLGAFYAKNTALGGVY